MSDIAIISVRNISKRFGKVQALSNINLDVHPGEFLTLLGPSGCGKTTLLRILAGFERPDSGEVYIENKDVKGIPPNKRDINLLFQNYALFPHMNVYGNIRFGLAMKKVDEITIKDEVIKYLKLVDLEGYGDRAITQLSGGESQRVALARALINKPKVLLLDEPLGALDLKLRKELQFWLKDIHSRLGTVFICVTHDQTEALTMSNRIVIMYKGNIIEDEEPVKLYNHPRKAFTASFLGEANILLGKVFKIKDKEGIDINITHDFNIKAQFKNKIKTGVKVRIAIRPEKMFISKNSTVKSNFAFIRRGIIKNKIFNGPIIVYEIRLDGLSNKIIVSENFEEETSDFNIGGEVFVYTRIKDIIILEGLEVNI